MTMLVVVVEPDSRRAKELVRELRARRCSAIRAGDFAAAERMLTSTARPAALFVADLVPPLSGADLLAVTERNPRLSGVPVIARVADERSLVAVTLARGGVRVVGADEATAAVADLLADAARSYDEADWRASVLAWSRYLQWRCGRARELFYNHQSHLQRERLRAEKEQARADRLRRAR